MHRHITLIGGAFTLKENLKIMVSDDIAPTIYSEVSGVYYIKLTIQKFGLYISGITVRKSPKYGGWWVQMPYYKDYKSGKTKRYIEFNEESTLWPIVENICIQAVEKEIPISNSHSTDVLPTSEDMKKEFDLTSI